MPTDRSGEPWGATYKGFSGAPPTAPQADEPPAAPPRRRSLRMPALMAAGVAAALALGLGFGFWARPELNARPAAPPAEPAEPGPITQTPAGADQLPIAVTPPPAGDAGAPSAGRLETLPPEMTAATQAPGQARSESAASDDDDGDETDDSTTTTTTTTRMFAPAPAAAAAAAPPPLHASFDCALPRPGAEQMVCSDPALAAEDLRLAEAYRRAERSGVDPAELRQKQRDWVAVREDAARRSHIALAQAYDQRTQELNRMADAADDDSDDEDDTQ